MIVAPSVLSANFMQLDKEIKSIEESGATWIHYDVMDGHFVPNISFGYSILKNIRPFTDLFLDVHLMISDPYKYLNEFISSGADLITFHYEAVEEGKISSLIEEIHKNNIKAGMSIKPDTPVKKIIPYLKDLDLVLVMSVEPGFGGQSFMPSANDKIKELRHLIDDYHYACLIEVDGGINDQTVQQVREAGCDVVVAGSYFFNSLNRKAAVELLK